MTLKTLIVTLEDKEVWTDLFVDQNKIIGTENDEEFYNKWLKNGINFNTSNKWE